MKIKEMTNGFYGKYDIEAAKILDSFLPNKIFDAHLHISHAPCPFGQKLIAKDYFNDMSTLVGNRELNGNFIPFPVRGLETPEARNESLQFLKSELETFPGSVGEILVFPDDTTESIEERIIHPAIIGLKCYHVYANREDTFNAEIEEYLPEAAWEVADKKGLAITLHMVKDKVLADEGNMNYIKRMAKKYPNATLILAHAARAFAAWTAIDNVHELIPLENVFCDLSGVCESPAMIAVIKNLGVKRCMWGSDWAVSMLSGKCVSIADTFYWISENDVRSFSGKTTLHTWLVGTENLMATREAFKLCDLNDDAVEDIFYNTAANLFLKK